MKTIGFICAIAFFLVACNQKDTVQIGKIEPSLGATNEVVLVIDDSLWKGAVGDSIRQVLALSVGEISTIEPIFDLQQYSPDNFGREVKKSRNIILFSANESYQFLLEKSLYATPQNFFFVREKNAAEMTKLFQLHSDSIVKTIKQTELNEIQLAIAKQPLQTTTCVKDWFAMTIKIPDEYRVKESIENELVWFQKDIASGDVNLLIYEVAIPDNHSEINQNIDDILAMRDMVTGHYIYGNQLGSYVYTDSNFVPVVYLRQQKKLPAVEIRGKWAMQNDFMTGPFISLVIKDDYYGRYLFLDGFVNNSFQHKRDQLLELEAIIKSINFYE